MEIHFFYGVYTEVLDIFFDTAAHGIKDAGLVSDFNSPQHGNSDFLVGKFLLRKLNFLLS
jgi:hypothetical protein